MIESDMIECGRGCIERARERWCGWIWRDVGERSDEGGIIGDGRLVSGRKIEGRIE